MIEVKPCANREEWDEYVLDHGGHPLQLWGWGEVKANHGWTAHRLFAYKGDMIVGCAQVLVRTLPFPLRAFAYTPRGPIVDAEHVEQTLGLLAHYTRTHFKAVALSIEPDAETYDVPAGWVHSKHRILPPKTILLDLTQHEAVLQDAMIKKTRQYIRKSAKDVVIRRVTDREELERCMEIYYDTSKRADFALHRDQYYYDVFEQLDECSSVFAAYANDQPVAFLWLAISADTAFELYGGMNELGQQLRANYALKWHAIKKMQQWGITRYDFGGLINDGVSTFKRSWTDHETEFAGTFDRPLSPFYAIWSHGLPFAKATIRKIKSLRK